MIKKYIKDGKVGVLVSPGFGAGWSTWASDGQEELIFCYELIEMILNEESLSAIEDKAEELFPNQYTGGLYSAIVTFLPIGTRFRIDEYDGNESLHVYSPDEGFIA